MGHVLENGVSVVSQERQRGERLPAAAQKQDIEIAVVVEICAGDVERVDLLVTRVANRNPDFERGG
jgi:hypothetical protein